ncbi:conjugal transfer protein TraG N-terminal domain-containing protein, partial [Leptospira sp. SA-E8]|uniref:conjugal transfer protein TraG N-terminal domain-containing protein n=1 Tax=Leptospira sp. SA-E8 TaxID=3422259 RepID=UPI003EBB5A84
ADIGTWEYYVYSDMASISRVLNGLAMWFNASSGALRAAAGLGALIVLGMALWGAAVKKSSISAPTIGLWLLFAASIGIQGRVHVQNIYTGQTTVVDHVPMIAILPASIFSQAGYKTFSSMETAFQGVTGSYMSVSQNGFASPLEILLSLRKPSTVPMLA